MSISAGTTLRLLRERKPLVHQITNYVVMNETANATLALGALPVMAHAREEVEEMVTLADALVLNIGTLSPHWVEAMLIAGKAANSHGVPVVFDPVGAGATRYRTDTARRILEQVKVSVLRGNQGEVATLVGVDAEVRGVESIGAGSERAEIARAAARKLDLVASVTGPVDQVSDGERVLAVANGHELLASVTGTGCMSSAITGCFLAAKRDATAGSRRRGARVVRRRRRGCGSRRGRTGLFPRCSLRRTCGTRSGHARLAYADLVKLHAIVDELETARLAVDGGATVVQWRLKDVARVDVVERGRATRSLCARFGVTFVVNDDVEAALMLGAEGVHLGRSDDGAERAKDNGLLLGLSAATLEEAREADERRGLHRGRPDLGDAVEAGRRSCDRARRPE